MAHNAVACVTALTALFATVLDDTDSYADELGHHDIDGINTDDELRRVLPLILSQLSPAARMVLRDYHGHVTELVAGLHRARNLV